MKPFLISALAIIISTASFSQVKPIRVDTIKTPNALCENCKKRIEAYVKPYDGILEITVNYRKAETKVKYLTDRINIEEIKRS